MNLSCYNFKVRYLRKNTPEILGGLGIFLLFLIFRLPNLTLQPIFADEAIYVRWAQVMRAEPTLRFLPLSDGKTPMYMWILMPFLKITQVLHINDPLFAGRLLSIIAGFFTLVGVYFLAKKLFGKKAGFWAALLYAITPYTVFFDRMALVDSLMSSFTIWSLYFAIWLVEESRLDIAMILGFLLGGGILTKTPAVINLVSLPFTIIGFKFSKKLKPIFKLIGLGLLAIVIGEGLYNLLRLGPNFQLLSSRNSDYIFPLNRIFTHPFDPFIGHTKQFSDYLLRLVGLSVIFMGVGIWMIVKRLHKFGIVILIWTFLPMLVFITYLQTFTARYLLLTIPTLLVVAGYGIDWLLQNLKIKGSIKMETIMMVLVLLAYPVYFNFLLLTNPAKAPLPHDERRGYLEDWTAGYGFPEIAQYLIDRQKETSVVVGTEGFFGTLPDGLQIYLDKSGIPVIGSRATVSAELRVAAKEHETYFVGNKQRLPAVIENAKLIKEYPKPSPLGNFAQDAIQFYRVYPE